MRWPGTSTIRFEGDHLPVWDEHGCTYVDPDTGEVLPSWDDALDAIGPDDEPLHVSRFGDRFDAQGVLAGSRATEPGRYAWEPVAPGDPDHMEHARRLLHVVTDRQRWQAALNEARRRASLHDGGGDVPATGRAAA